MLSIFSFVRLRMLKPWPKYKQDLRERQRISYISYISFTGYLKIECPSVSNLSGKNTSNSFHVSIRVWLTEITEKQPENTSNSSG